MMQSYTRGKFTFIVNTIEIDGLKLYHLSVRPPMTDDEYDDMKYRIESLGGHWRERFNGFIFDENPIKLLQNEDTWKPIEHSAMKKWKVLRQFYPTPPDVAKRVVELAEITDKHVVLEPSAGSGALIRPIGRTENIVAVEIDDTLAEVLTSLGYSVVHSSFEDAIKNGNIHKDYFDRVVMNPPFGPRQKGLKHIMMAYDLMKENGVLVAVISENDLYYNTETTREFNRLLRETNAMIEPVPHRSFLVSGTRIDTVIIKMRKK